jgi:hypothetical protein
MPHVGDLEVGVMFWAGSDPVETIREVKSLGCRVVNSGSRRHGSRWRGGCVGEGAP